MGEDSQVEARISYRTDQRDSRVPQDKVMDRHKGLLPMCPGLDYPIVLCHSRHSIIGSRINPLGWPSPWNLEPRLWSLRSHSLPLLRRHKLL